MNYFLLAILWLCVAQLCRASLGGHTDWYNIHWSIRVVGIWFVPFIYLVFAGAKLHIYKGVW